MQKHKLFIVLSIALTFIAILFLIIGLPEMAFARPGGGHGFHGGGHSGGYSGGHSSGGGDLAYILFYCLINYPIPTIIVIILSFIIYKIMTKDTDYDSVSSKPTSTNTFQNKSKMTVELNKLYSTDKNFSKPIFLDFASLLYTRYYQSIGKDDLSQINPFFKVEINKWDKYYITEIVIGSANIIEISTDKDSTTGKGITKIVVQYIGNYTAVSKENPNLRYRCDITENWQFIRGLEAVSTIPQGMGVLRCPHCGATAKFTDAGTCESCGSTICNDNDAWKVNAMSVVNIKKVKTSDVISYAEEIGTDYNTIYDKYVKSNELTFLSLHNNKGYNDFNENIAKPYFYEIYKQYSNLTWEKARHLVSERQWQSMNFWITFCKEYDCHNALENVKISKIETVKYESDNYYESITVRIFASCIDYFKSSDGRCIAGNNHTPRYFSEYWTFVCRNGVDVSAKPLNKCPNCGAPADKMGQSGVCEYCGSKITDGNFSWVLFSITQDEVYEG
ncbi:MAG: Tim44 domain-containing protein [Bacteroidales bacterium]|nr:Tim44 domain-containing protein [Bacteroidales bacterium]